MSASFLVLAGSFTPMISTLNFTVSPPSLTLVSQTASGTSPSWLLSNPANSSIFYATDESVENGAINSLVVDTVTGQVTPVDSIPCPGGPTHLGLVDNGTQIGAANYGGKNALFVNLESDQLHFSASSAQTIQFGDGGNSNPHQIVSFGDQVLVPDLGADRVWRVVKSESDDWTVQDFVSQPTGSGPRHIVVDDGSLYVLNELANTLSQQSISSSSTDEQPETLSSSSIVPPDTPSGASMHAGELLLSQTPTPLLYASNRDDPSSDGDTIAIFELNPLNKVADVRTGLKHLRGVAFIGENDAYLIAGGMNGGGIKVYERVSADQGYLREVASLASGVDQPASFIWIPPQDTPQPVSTSQLTQEAPTPTVATSTSIIPTTSRSGACRRYKIGI